MEDIVELVIKIPMNAYDNLIKYGYKNLGSFDCGNILKAVTNGTVLPKGHGRIADIDAAIKCIEEVKGEDAVWAISLIEWACGKRTIMEVDKTESEE